MKQTIRGVLAMVVFSGLVAVSVTASAQGEVTLKTSAKQSSIQAVGAKITGDHTLSFANFEGAITLKGEVPTGISFTVQAAEFSTEMDNEYGKKLEGHLRSPDFFNVAKYPTATFESTSIKAEKSKWGTHMVQGKLTMRGKTQTIQFPATISVSKGGVVGKTQFTINRKDFGMVYNGKADDLIKDDVLLKIELKATR